jgi:exodeoxyribonuclease V beta subunit
MEGDRAGGLDPLALPLSGTTLIEASAGTGKTHSITTLYTRLLLEAELNVDQILVVTYTNAATAELRARIRRRLHDLLRAFDGETPEDEVQRRFVEKRLAAGLASRDRGRLLAALHGFDLAAIFTIHGFCQRMLQEHAFESGVAFDIELLADQRPLIDEIVLDFWVRELHAAPDDLVQHVLAKNGPLASLKQLADLASLHPEIEALGPAAAENDPETRWRRLQIECMAWVRQELQRRKRAAHVQSFDDLLQRLAEALRSDRGPALAARIRQRLPAALIDEFQDTDPLQYDIFRRIYHGVTGTSLFLIGDPKQAIYAFRGADVFAYLAAKKEAAPAPPLLTNWRSGPTLIRAINTLFARSAPFLLDDIHYEPGRAAAPMSDALGGSAAGLPPFEILLVRREEDTRSGGITKPWVTQHLNARVAAEIVRFVRSGATIGDRPVQPADVAVLCRTNQQAAGMQEALRALGVPSVLQSEGSVFDTAEAEEVARLLRAMAEPGDSAAIRAALATAALGLRASELHALQSDEAGWDGWVQRFQDWNETWLRHGFIAAFRRMLAEKEVAPRLLALIDGERRLTNVLHLAELLHAASVEERLGPSALAHWLGRMRGDKQARSAVVGEAAQIRLESDDAAVKLVTIHKSKGLQYPIVYCPYLWDGKPLHKNDRPLPRFHDRSDGDRLKIDLGSPSFKASQHHAEREALAESLRLLYVALTRAQHRCSVVWGAFYTATDTALGYILHEAGDRSPEASAKRIKKFFKDPDDGALRADIERLAARSGGAIGVRDLPAAGSVPQAPQSRTDVVLECRSAQRRIGLSQRTASFSSLIRSGAPLSQPAEEGQDHDMGTGKVVVAPPTAAAPIALHDFPAGARTGQILHDLLERLDFASATTENVLDAVERSFAGTGLASWSSTVSSALIAMLDTPLDKKGLRLRQIAPEKRLNELEFLFPVALREGAAVADPSQLGGWSQGTVAPLNVKRLASVFAKHAAPPLCSYANQLVQLDFPTLAGFLKGYIDLVFEHGGHWYVVDYKSNLLGSHAAAYAPDALLAAMTSHHYILQYHLYVVALHRYLTRRLPDYDYDRHFGGVHYLFLRGMHPDHPPGTGVFSDRPLRRLIEKLSETLAG